MTIYLIDTNILMSLESYDGLLARCKGKITVPMYVLEELDIEEVYQLEDKEQKQMLEQEKDLEN